MLRKDTLNQIQEICEEKYVKLIDFTHGIGHIKEVVKISEKIAREEKLKEKDVFLIKIAAWLHDLGRIDEQELGEEIDHAEASYRQARNILKSFQSKIGREGTYKILQAIREHSLAILDHKENVIAKTLQDADRGSNLSVFGIYRILAYKKVLELKELKGKENKKGIEEELIVEIKKGNKVKEAINWIEYLRGFYYGEEKRGETKVMALHTKSAKKMFKKGILDIERFLTRLKSKDELK